MKNEIKIFENKELGFQVRTVLNEDGSISVNAEDTATGYGWYREKNGKEYIMWDRFNGYCKELGFPHKCGKDDYIPESLFYMLGFKAENERAVKYQQWLAMDVLPTLRKTGTYSIGKNITVSFKEQVECVGVVADILRVNDASKIMMIGQLYKSYDLPTEFLPKYEYNGSRELKSATDLLKKFDLGMTARNFNILLREQGYLEERTRKSSSSKTGSKKYNALTEKGLKYGENAVSPQCQREVQPMYYVDTFEQLFDLVMNMEVA